VTISLDNPTATALDQAPVTVSIISASAKGALAVPIAALLAREQGRYAVEVAGPGDRTHLVSVQTGLFDDQDGLVQISGAGVTPGTRVVMPSVS
jgi:multidrug efflux pump subunit AcrA (membrane-fusion protein)